MAETSSLLNCRTGYRTGGSNPPASAYFAWRFRLVARTHASHAWNTGSIPVGATKANTDKKQVLGHMPLTPRFFTNMSSTPVGATKKQVRFLLVCAELKATEFKSSKFEIMALSSSG